MRRPNGRAANRKAAGGETNPLNDVPNSPPSERIARALQILDSIRWIGDEADHRETYEVLREAERESGLSVRKRLP